MFYQELTYQSHQISLACSELRVTNSAYRVDTALIHIWHSHSSLIVTKHLYQLITIPSGLKNLIFIKSCRNVSNKGYKIKCLNMYNEIQTLKVDPICNPTSS